MTDEASRTRQFLESGEFCTAMDEFRSSINRKLVAAGLVPVADPHFYAVLYDFLHSEFNLTNDEIDGMNWARLDPYLDRWIQKHGAIEPGPNERHVWKGLVWQFGEWVDTAYQSGFLSADSFADALKKICDHFVQEDGTPMSWRSVQQSLNQHKEGERSPKVKRN
jgi:hypothetical protein